MQQNQSICLGRIQKIIFIHTAYRHIFKFVERLKKSENNENSYRRDAFCLHNESTVLERVRSEVFRFLYYNIKKAKYVKHKIPYLKINEPFSYLKTSKGQMKRALGYECLENEHKSCFNLNW